MSSRPTLIDPPFWPKDMTLEGKLRRLKLIAPQDYRAIELITDDALRTRWWQLGPDSYRPKARLKDE